MVLASHVFDDWLEERVAAGVDEDRARCEQALLHAAIDGFEPNVHAMLDRGVDLEVTDTWGNTALSLAAENGHIRVVKLLVANGANIEGSGSSWTSWFGDMRARTPLMGAVTNNREEVVRFLAESGAAVNVTDSQGWTPLMRAVERNQIDMMRVLWKHGADVNVKDKNGWTLLMIAIRNDVAFIVDRLLKHGAAVNDDIQDQHPHSVSSDAILSALGSEDEVRDRIECSPLAWASKHGGTKVIRVLLNHGADIEAADKFGRTALMMAIRYGKSPAVDLLLKYGAPVDGAMTNSEVLLQLAMQYDHALLVGLLAKRNAPMVMSDEESRSLFLSVVKKCRRGIVMQDLRGVFPHVEITSPMNWTCFVTTVKSFGHLDGMGYLVVFGSAVDMKDSDSETLLQWAIDHNHVDIVKTLAENNVAVNVSDSSGQLSLMRAIEINQLDMMRVLLTHGADVNARDSDGWTPLMAASRYGHMDAARLLIDHNADVNVKVSNGWTPLILASRYGRTDAMRMLIDHNADVNAKGSNGCTPLMLAIDKKYGSVINLLLKYDAVVNGNVQDHPEHSVSNDKILSALGPEDEMRDRIECSPLAWTSRRGNTKVMRILLGHGADIETADKYGRTALMMAVRFGKSSAVDLLLKYGAAVDGETTNSEVLLQLAMQYDHALLVGLLAKRNAPMDRSDEESRSLILSVVKKCRSEIVMRDLLDVFPYLEITDPMSWTTFVMSIKGLGHLDRMGHLVVLGSTSDAKNSHGETLLQWAINHNQVDIVKTLAENNIAINICDFRGQSPLMRAVENNQIDLMQVLLTNSTDVNEIGADGWTPLMQASYNGHTEAVQVLIDHNADVNVKDSNGWTPLMLASRYGHMDAARLLIDHNADVNVKVSNGWTPLMLASYNGHTDVMRVLIDHNADVNVKVSNGWTPLMLASRHGRTDAMRLLIDHNADVDVMDESSMTPLTQAIKYGHETAVFLLVGSGAAVGTNYRMGDTLFQWFIEVDYCHVAELQASVQFGADFNDSSLYERSEFVQIRWRGYSGVENASMGRCAERNHKERYNLSVLMRVAKIGNANAIRLLAAFGADVDAEVKSGQTPLLLAAMNGNPNVVRALLDCGATINASSSGTGETALMTAARHGHEQVTRLVLEHGANVNAVSTNGETALSIAAKYGRNSIAKLLTRHVVYEDDITKMQDASDRNVQCSWFISPFELEFLRSGDVAGDIRGTWLGAEVIIKLFVSDATNATFIDEVNLWHKLRHPNIIKLYGACNVGHHFFVYECASNGSLVDYLRKCDPDGRTPWKYLHEAALGLKYLHERGIVHGDLRGSNILIGNDGLAKLSAFDVSASSNTREASESGEWVRWASPEAIRGEQTSLSSDIFSFGVCMLETLTRRQPWSDLSESEVMDHRKSFESLDQPRDLDLSSDHWDVISRMCCSNPLDRLTVSAVVQRLEAFSQMERFDIRELAQLEFNPPDALDDEKTERLRQNVNILVEHSDNALHHQLVSDLDLVHDQLKNAPPTRVFVDRFHDVLRQCRAALRVISAKHRIYHLSSTQATVNNVHELHRRVVHLLQDMGAPSDVVTKCEAQWEAKRREQMEMFVSAVSNKCVILQRLETEDDRKAYLAILDEEMHNQEATYTDHQLNVMRNAHDAIANQTLDDVSLTSPPEWFIPWFEFEKEGMYSIADGGFGSVSRGRWLDSEVVVKTMLTYDGLDTSKKHQMRKMFEREADIWFRLSHPHVVRLFGACHVGRPFFVCEYASNGTLNNYIRRHPDRVWMKLREAALGVQYLHARGIVHGDLKGNNIVVGADDKAKVTDFGLSWLCDDISIVAPVSGACGWVAPECLEDNPVTPTLASDVYSLGMCIIESLRVIGNVKITTPWGDLLPIMVKREATSGKLPRRPQNCSSEVWELVERMCKRDPADRICIATVVEELTKLAMQTEKCDSSNTKDGATTTSNLPLSEQDEKALELYPPPPADEESVGDLIDGVQAHIIGHLGECKSTYTSRTLGEIYKLLWERVRGIIEQDQGEKDAFIPGAIFNHFVLVARARTLLLVENMHRPKLVRFTEGALGGYGLHRRLDTLLDSNRVVLNNHELHDWRTKFSVMLGME